MFLFSLLFCVSCQQEKSVWASADDCSVLQKGKDKDNCFSIYIVEVFREDPSQGIKVVQEEISEQQIRDFIWLKVTREYNPATREYCDRIQDKTLKERCHTLSSRPHLHRDILREK